MSASKALRLAAFAAATASTFVYSQPIAIAPTESVVQFKRLAPAVPVRIEDVSKLQAEKMQEDILKRFGMTSASAAPPSNPAPAAAVSQTKPRTPTRTLQVLAIYGTGDQLKAEMLVDGSFRLVRAGDVLWPGMQIAQISQRVTLARASAKQKPQQLNLAAGEAWEGR